MLLKGVPERSVTYMNTTRAVDERCWSLWPAIYWHVHRKAWMKHYINKCLLNHLFRRRSKKTSKLRVTGLCTGNSPGPVNSPHKGPVTRKMFPFDDVMMHWSNAEEYGQMKIFLHKTGYVWYGFQPISIWLRLLIYKEVILELTNHTFHLQFHPIFFPFNCECLLWRNLKISTSLRQRWCLRI